MSTFYLINTVTVGSTVYFAGRLCDSTVDPTTAIAAAGGTLWPSSNPDVAAAAAIVAKARVAGANETTCTDFMTSAAALAEKTDLASHAATRGASLVGLQDAGGYFGATPTVEGALQALGAGTAGTAAGIVEASFAITQAAVAALGSTTTGHLDFAGALPANARFLGALISVTTKFQNAGDTATIDSDIGDGSTADLYLGDADLHTTGEKFAGDAGGKQFQTAAAVTPRVSFTSSVNLSLITAGAAVAKVFYIILA